MQYIRGNQPNVTAHTTNIICDLFIGIISISITPSLSPNSLVQKEQQGSVVFEIYNFPKVQKLGSTVAHW